MQQYLKGEIVHVETITKENEFDYAKLTILAVSSVKTQNGVIALKEKLYAYSKDQALTKPEGLGIIKLFKQRTSTSKDGRKFLWIESDTNLSA